MSTCEREKGIMVKTAISSAGGVTCIAGGTAIDITTYTVVSIICFGFIVMRMTVDAGVNCIVGRICMAIGTLIPDRTIMFPGINREIGIMNGELGGFPTQVGRMAIGTGRR